MNDKRIVLKNGIIIDGSGKERYKADILIENEKMKKIGDIDAENKNDIIDINGLIIAPGFIDVHTHLDFIIASPRHSKLLESWVKQGVTTIIAGNCGFSPAPIRRKTIETLNTYWNFSLPKGGLEYSWNTMDEYFNHLEKIGQSLNVVILTGHNTLRLNAMGLEARFAEKAELEDMLKMLKESLDAGSFGLSLGLGYVPGLFSHTDELIELGSVLKKYNVPLVPHTRGLLSKNYDKAIMEVIEISEKNGISLQISHHAGGGIGRTRKKAIKAIEEAKERGVEIGHDNIAWPNTSTTVLSLFPPWAFDGGIKAFFERLRNEIILNQIKEEMRSFRPKWPNWENKWWVDRDYNENIILTGFKLQKYQRYNNMQLKEIAKDFKKESLDVLIKLVLDEEGKFFIITGQFDNPLAEDFIANLYRNPNCSVGTDIVGLDQKTPHPVAYGTFPKILGTIVREKKILSLEEAIRKMTSLPASQMRIEKRGSIKEGYFTDLTIFNPETIKCTSSFKNPFQEPIGVKYVFINGNMIFKNNQYDEKAFAGKVLRRTK